MSISNKSCAYFYIIIIKNYFYGKKITNMSMSLDELYLYIEYI